ncbi:MAG: hypothetical protein KGI41_01185 [Patescibacteria group bacterium]|nr:hypothetical protein [Patescibacteria group bacterium]MDE1965840.1 hypothetical protein [Patescibacteria group bacterium]
MTDVVYPLLIDLHALAALLGAGIALFAEYGRVRALADGVMDEHERVYLTRLGRALAASVLALLIVNPLLALLEYGSPFGSERVLTAAFWFENTLILFIIFDLWLMAKRYVPLWFGGAVSLSGYLGILLLTFFGGVGLGYFGMCVLYAVGVFVTGGVLEYAHILTRTYVPKDSPS